MSLTVESVEDLNKSLDDLALEGCPSQLTVDDLISNNIVTKTFQDCYGAIIKELKYFNEAVVHVTTTVDDLEQVITLLQEEHY